MGMIYYRTILVLTNLKKGIQTGKEEGRNLGRKHTFVEVGILH